MAFTNIVLMGDSITAMSPGFKAELYSQLVGGGKQPNFIGSQHDGVYHEGYPSLTSAGLLAKMSAMLAAYQPGVAVVLIGVNDVFTAVPTETTLDNIAAVIAAIRAACPLAAIVLPLLTPVADRVRAHGVEHINLGLYRIAAEDEAVTVALTGAVTVADLLDGVHPNGSGHTKLAAALSTAILPLMA